MMGRARHTSPAVRCHPGCRCNQRRTLPDTVHELDSIGISIFRFYKSPLLNEKGVA